MSKVFEMLASMAIWITGCAVFDLWLGLSGPWLMLGGAATLMVAEWVQRGARSNNELTGGALAPSSDRRERG